MNITAAIWAHPARKKNAERLAKKVGCHVIYDTNPVPSADPLQRWTTCRRTWESLDPTADYGLVLQDDIDVSTHLLDGLETALDELGPDGLLSAYTGTKRPQKPRVQREVNRATAAGHTWMSLRSLHWGPAICAPMWTVPDMLDTAEEHVRTHQPPYSNADYAIGVYYRDVLGWRTWYTLPSLVEHLDMPSLIGHDDGRTAHVFHAGDARDIDWTRHDGLDPYVERLRRR